MNTLYALAALSAQETDSGSSWRDKYPIIPHTGELIFGFIAFAILYYVVARVVVPRLEQVFAERAAAIEGGIAKAEEAQAQANAALEEYQHQLAAARAEAGRIRQEAQEQGATILAELREQAQAEASRITSAAHQQIQAERQQALVQLRTEVGRLAIDLASRIVGESLEDEARQRRTVDRFLAEVEGAEPVGTGPAPSGSASAPAQDS